MSVEVGYCCINQTLQKDFGITTNRSMILRTFNQRGINYASELALANTYDLLKILEWNILNNVKVFRMSSDLFPWSDRYEIADLPSANHIIHNLTRAGELIKENGIRVTAHPDHFVKLASVTPHVVDNSIRDLEKHNEVFNLMGLPANHTYCLNIHIGQNSKDIDKTVLRFLKAFERLSDSCKRRLVVENDDKEGAFSVHQLYYYLYKTAGIPVTFDYFHHTFHTNGLSEQDAFETAYSTWDTLPLFHYSESKTVNEQVKCNPRAHADYVYKKINSYGYPVDIDLEAKAKEKALFKYRELHGESHD